MKIAIIPARGGSKRIPLKSIKMFYGKPLIAYSIQAAKDSGLFDRILVSTDSQEIMDVARQWGAEVPFIRPAHLADDHTPTQPVIDHAVAWCHEHWGRPDYFCYLYANPFILPENIRQCFQMLLERKADVALSVTNFPYPILRSFKLCEDATLAYAFPENADKRSQDLPEFFHDVGQFYWHDADWYFNGRGRRPCKSYPFFIPRYLTQDLDNDEDWEIAEKLYGAFLNGKQ